MIKPTSSYTVLNMYIVDGSTIEFERLKPRPLDTLPAPIYLMDKKANVIVLCPDGTWRVD